MERQLQGAGLTEVESKIYITLLDLGPSLAGDITQRSGIHRRSVYDAIERLIQKGLVSYIVQNNRKYFEAVNPEHLMTLMKQKEEALIKHLPLLKAKYQTQKKKQETLFYKGKQALRAVFEDELEVGKEILIVGASSQAKEILTYYFQWFDKRRIEKKIPIKLLYPEEERKKRKIPYAQIRYLPEGYTNPAAMNIYGDHIAIIHWSKERPFAILIKDEEIAHGYKNYFELLWNIAKK